jgi:hypothetical protein
MTPEALHCVTSQARGSTCNRRDLAACINVIVVNPNPVRRFGIKGKVSRVLKLTSTP